MILSFKQKIISQFFLILLISFLFSSFVGCKKDYFLWNLITWEDNKLYYRLNTEEVALGELLFLEIESELQPGIQFELVTQSGNPILERVFDFKFVDGQNKRAVAEFVWTEKGEKIISGLAIQFIDLSGKKHRVNLEDFYIEVIAQVGFNPQDPATLVTAIESFQGPIPFSSFLFLYIAIGIFLLVSGIVIFILVFLKKQKLKQEKINYTLYFRKIDEELRHYRSEKSQDALIQLYNLLLESKKIIKLKQFDSNSKSFDFLNQFLEKALFMKNIDSLKEKLTSAIEENSFLNQYEDWIKALEVKIRVQSREIQLKQRYKFKIKGGKKDV